jgi:Tfp pilus assembly protein PilF
LEGVRREAQRHIASVLYINLACVYHNQGCFTDTEGALKGLLAIDKKELLAHHDNTLNTMHNLTMVYHQQGRYKEAKDILVDR